MKSQPSENNGDTEHGDSEAYLFDHYRRLGDQTNDFRNGNLTRLISGLVEGGDVLDIGCGTGQLLGAVERKGCRRLVGVDPSEGLIELARRMHPQLEFVCGSGEAIERIEGLFDSITIIDVLEHIEDDRQQLKMIFNRLKPGGLLVILVPAHPVLYGPRDIVQGHFRRYTRRDLVTKIKEAGFEPQRLRSWNAIAWLPQYLFSRILKRVGREDLREAGPKNFLQRKVIKVMNLWYGQIENRFSFGFGSSLICTARRPVEP